MAPIGPIDLDEVQLVLGPRLRELTVPPARRRYGAVLVAPAEAARGLAFDVVFVPGLAEKLFPRKIVEDPILLDPHRRALEVPALATQPARVGAERLALRLAVGAARERVVLSWPRVDIEQARPRVPSFYGLEALAGHQLGARPFSPTALQHFAACPYRFFLQAVMRLQPREEPVAIEVLDPLTRGALFHEVQFAVLSELRAAELLPVRPANLDAARAAVDGALDTVAARWAEKLWPAIDRVWRDGIDGIRADLREWLRRAADAGLAGRRGGAADGGGRGGAAVLVPGRRWVGGARRAARRRGAAGGRRGRRQPRTRARRGRPARHAGEGKPSASARPMMSTTS